MKYQRRLVAGVRGGDGCRMARVPVSGFALRRPTGHPVFMALFHVFLFLVLLRW